MQNIQSSIESANKQFMDLLGQGDVEAIADLYTPEARLLPPGAPMMTGREAIKAFWQGAIGMGIKAARLETIQVEPAGNTACEIGRFSLTVQPDGGEPVDMLGKYVVVWKIEDATPKLHIDIWNTDQP